MEDSYTIYVHRNKLNGMCYVGQTKQRPQERWWGGSSYREERGSLFGKAIKEFGWSAFEHIILETGLSKEEADEAERKYTTKFNSITPNGYNTDSGGRKGSKKTDIVKEHLKEAHRKSDYKVSEETRRKMSEARKKRWEDPEYRKAVEKHLAENSRRIAEDPDKYFPKERRAAMSASAKKMWETADEEKRNRMLGGLERGRCNEQDERPNGN